MMVYVDQQRLRPERGGSYGSVAEASEGGPREH